jgi:hypothetical protein
MSTTTPEPADQPPPAPSPRRRTRRIAFTVLGVVVLVLVGSLLFGRNYATTQTAKRTFTLDKNFTEVRSILVQTDGTKQIIAMAGDSEFVDQKWTAVGLDPTKNESEGATRAQGASGGLIKRLLESTIHLHGDLRVHSLDDYIGRPEVELKQDVELSFDQINSTVDLAKETARLKRYKMTTHFGRDAADKGTVVELSLTQEILTDAPWFAHRVADRRVRASAERALSNQETAIRKLIDENKDKIPIFPLR